MADQRNRLQPTRVRDLVALALIAGVAGYLLTRLNYTSLPRLPRLAGVSAALLGIGEAIAGWGIRKRIRAYRRPEDPADPVPAVDLANRPRPVDPLLAARALAVAKASALAAAVLIGAWLGFLGYVAQLARGAEAPAADAVTAVIGAICAGVLLAGALWLESCCRAPR